jgi:phage terminase large subunit-like protein
MAAKRKTTPPARTSTTDPVTDYAKKVVAGKIIAGPHVRNACRRHLQDLRDGPKRGLVWDIDAAQRAIGFYRDALCLNGGQFEGRPFILEPSQAFKTGSIFGWKWKATGKRRFRRIYIEEGKGNGKSPWAAGIGLYCLAADKEQRAEVYAAGKDKEQAQVLFRDAVAMVDQSPALLARLHKSGGNHVYNIAHLKSGSFFKPLAKKGAKSGPRPSCALCDEIHEHPSGEVIEMLERGFKFREQPMLVMITNSGSDRQSICWVEHQNAVQVAAGTRTPDDEFTYVGEVLDDTLFSYVCALDKGDDPLTDPSCWVKANPLLGVILTHDYLAGVVKQAIDLPAKLNGILRLHFCVWTDSSSAWMSRKLLDRCLMPFKAEEYRGKKTFSSSDLSATQDMTAAAFVVPTGTVERERVVDDRKVKVILPTFAAWVEAWTPADTIAERAKRDQAPYEQWVKDGWLVATPGPAVRLDYVAARFQAAQADYQLQGIAYDRYGFKLKFEAELDAVGVTVPTFEHPQGGTRRAKPDERAVAAAKASGGIEPEGLWFPGSVRELETLILEERIVLQASPVLISAIMSVVTESDPFDNRWFSKRRATNRIDAAVALAMAVGLATSRIQTKFVSVYETRGIRRT